MSKIPSTSTRLTTESPNDHSNSAETKSHLDRYLEGNANRIIQLSRETTRSRGPHINHRLENLPFWSDALGRIKAIVEMEFAVMMTSKSKSDTRNHGITGVVSKIAGEDIFYWDILVLRCMTFGIENKKPTVNDVKLGLPELASAILSETAYGKDIAAFNITELRKIAEPPNKGCPNCSKNFEKVDVVIQLPCKHILHDREPARIHRRLSGLSPISKHSKVCPVQKCEGGAVAVGQRRTV